MASLSPDIIEIRIRKPLTENDARNLKKVNDQTLQVVASILDTVQQRIDIESKPTTDNGTPKNPAGIESN